MRARRALLPVLLLAVSAYLHRMPSRELRSAADEDWPHATAPIAVPKAPGTIEELRVAIAKILQREHVAGAAIALIGGDGPIWVGGVGVSDLATRREVNADTVFRVGSLSKSVVALGVMRLVDQGKLELDRPLREILPDLEFDNPWEAEAPVTLAQCMEHTTGWDDVRFNEIFTEDEGIAIGETLARNPRSRRSRWRPGTRHGYSNIGFTVAARAIEVATGEPFDVYLKREILGPMGIGDADFRRTEQLSKRLASGYMDSDEPITFRAFAHRPSGSLLASATDLGKLIQFWVARGEGYPPIVSKAGLARIEQSSLPYPKVDAVYGFANYADVMHPVITRGHDGGMPGFHASFRYIPELGVGYALLLNSNYTFRGYFDLRSLLFAYLTKGREFPPPPVVATLEKPGAPFFGLGNPHNEVFGFIERLHVGWGFTDLGDRLHVASIEGWHNELFPSPDGGYRFAGEYGSSVRFTQSLEGEPIALLWNAYGEATPEWPARMRYVAHGLAMGLLKFAVPWALAMLIVGLLNRRRIVPTAVVLWPAIAALACVAMDKLMQAAFFAGVIGDVHPLTVGIFVASIAFAIAAIATLVSSVRALVCPERPSILAMLFPIAFGIAFCGLALWWGANGLIGLRTWSW